MADPRIHDIGHPTGLKPRAQFFPEIGEECINLDGMIELMKRIDTPEAKAIYRAFRKRHAQMRLDPQGRDAEKLRGDAVLAALEDCGVRVKLTPIAANVNTVHTFKNRED